MKKSTSKILSLSLAVCLILGMFTTGLPPVVMTAQAAAINDMNALDALGIDSSIAPEGFDPYDQGNPYGKGSVTLNPVSELVRIDTQGGGVSKYLYGHNSKATTVQSLMNSSVDGYFVTNAANGINSGIEYLAAVSGNFTGSANGNKSEIAYVGIAKNPRHIYLFFNSAVNNETSYVPINLSTIYRDNPFDSSMYYADMLKYLKLTTGDFDNDGYDEVAVYIPLITASEAPHIQIYKLKITSASNEKSYLI